MDQLGHAFRVALGRTRIKENGSMLEARGVSGTAGSALFSTPAPQKSVRAERWLSAQFGRAAREGVFTTTAELGPELAELLLVSNPQNRPQHLSKVAEYARDIAAGNWAHNGETIILSDTNELNDGQHRCAAVVLAGRSITVEMTFGVPRETRSTVDVGIKRTVGQHLSMRGYSDGNALAHAISLILSYGKTACFYRLKSEDRPTTAEVLEWAAQNDIDDNLRAGRNVAKLFSLSVGLLTSIHYVLARINRADADSFFEDIREGENLSKSSPVYKLRDILIRNNAKAKLRHSDSVISATFINAWNARRRRRSPRSLLPDQDPTTFPVPE